MVVYEERTEERLKRPGDSNEGNEIFQSVALMLLSKRYIFAPYKIVAYTQ